VKGLQEFHSIKYFVKFEALTIVFALLINSIKFIMEVQIIMTKNYLMAVKSLTKRHSVYAPFLLLSVLIMCTIGCEGADYSGKANKLVDSIENVLISEKVCNDKNDCVNKQYIFFNMGFGREIEMSIYGIADKLVISKIIVTLIEEHKKDPGITYELTMYSITKDEEYKNSKPKKTILKLVLEKED
jgi:hypothetical protein